DRLRARHSRPRGLRAVPADGIPYRRALRARLGGRDGSLGLVAGHDGDREGLPAQTPASTGLTANIAAGGACGPDPRVSVYAIASYLRTIDAWTFGRSTRLR